MSGGDCLQAVLRLLLAVVCLVSGPQSFPAQAVAMPVAQAPAGAARAPSAATEPSAADTPAADTPAADTLAADTPAAEPSPGAPMPTTGEGGVDAKPESGTAPPASAHALWQSSRSAIVVILAEDRDGRQRSIGTGFVVSTDGLIATNLHVIGEGRSVKVQLSDGNVLNVERIEASDRTLDLAVLKVQSEHAWEPLELAPPGSLQPGEPVVALGHPQGLQHSIVQGVLSARREIEGRPMLQLAMPVEPGNSGGPVLDLQGRVQGIVTLKSAVTDNLGFAADVGDLRKLLAQPNPVPMERWQAHGQLDPRAWQVMEGANWRRRSGTLWATGVGSGDGGRTLCLAQTELPELPYEIAVRVKLDDEAGAAGLAFLFDDRGRHYGFYASAGKLRLTCFQGPSVFTWEVLANLGHPAYRAGEWNRLKVRVTAERILAYVNDELVVETRDVRWQSGRAGLVKFRQTEAQFAGFAQAAELPATQLTPERRDALEEQLAAMTGDARPTWDDLAASELARGDLFEQSRRLRDQAQQLEQLADDLHVSRVCHELSQLTPKANPAPPEPAVGVASDAQPSAERVAQPLDLLRAALWISSLDNAELDVEAYVSEVDRMADEIRTSLAPAADPAARLARLDAYLFAERGFHGSRAEYYHRANSYIDRVIDDHEGIPITLTILYRELGTRLGLDIDGLALPGHFMARVNLPLDKPPAGLAAPTTEPEPEKSASVFVDVFQRGERLSRAELEQRIWELSGVPVDEKQLRAASEVEVLVRVLRNLVHVAEREQDRRAMLRYLEAMLAIDPSLGPERGVRAILRYEQGRRADSLADLDWLLEHKPAEVNLERVAELRESFAQQQPLP